MVFMARFVLLLTPGTEAPPQDVLAAHGAYLKGLLDSGTLVAAGSLEDPPEGLVVIEAEDVAAAVAVAEADPVVTDGDYTASIRKWNVAFEA